MGKKKLQLIVVQEVLFLPIKKNEEMLKAND